MSTGVLRGAVLTRHLLSLEDKEKSTFTLRGGEHASEDTGHGCSSQPGRESWCVCVRTLQSRYTLSLTLSRNLCRGALAPGESPPSHVLTLLLPVPRAQCLSECASASLRTGPTCYLLPPSANFTSWDRPTLPFWPECLSTRGKAVPR